jgi:ABC-type amino acid transport system permease subunit
MIYVVLPQALANALPSLGNEFITLIKDSSLLSTIAVAELTYNAGLVAARTYEHFTMYVGIACIYFAMCFTTARLLGWMERRLRAGNK